MEKTLKIILIGFLIFIVIIIVLVVSAFIITQFLTLEPGT